MLHLRFYILLMPLLGLVAGMAMPAYGISPLYQGVIAVADQSREQRRGASRQALRQVLVKLSGNDAVTNNPAIEKALDRAPALMEQYQYRANTDVAQVEQGLAQRLIVNFSESAVKQILFSAGEAFWPENRPKVLVWLVEDTPENGKRLLNRQSDSDAVVSLEKSAAARGVELMFPVLDLQDSLAVPLDRLWRMDQRSVTAASERYDAGAVLLGRISTASSGRVIGTWQFNHRQESFERDFQTTQIGEQTDQAIDATTRFLAARYAVLPNESQSVVMSVVGVEDYAHYRKVVDHLLSLAQISDVFLDVVDDNTMLLRIDTQSAVAKLQDSLAFAGKLEVANDDTGSEPWVRSTLGTRQNPLVYRLLQP